MSRLAVVFSIFAALSLASSPVFAGAAEKEATELYKKGIELGNQGKIEEAIQAFQDAVKKVPRFSAAWLKLGYALELADRWPEALACYDAAIDSQGRKKKTAPYDYLGKLYRKMGLFDLAIDAHKKAIAIDKKKKSYKSHYYLALVYYDQKLVSDAVRELTEAVKIQPDFEDARIALGTALINLEQADKAREHFEAVLAKSPENAAAIYGLGLVERDLGNKDVAKEHFKKACKLGSKKACREAKGRYRALQ